MKKKRIIKRPTTRVHSFRCTDEVWLQLKALAKECGIKLTAADLEKKEEAASRELLDDELDAVAGGFDNNTCFCIAGGGGGGKDSKDGKTYGCACVLYGQGGDGRANDYNCTCVGCGSGDDANNEFLHD